MVNNKVSLSVLVPVYNELFLVEASLERLMVLRESNYLSMVEVIVVDDCSSDGTTDVLNRLHNDIVSSGQEGFFEWIFLRHEKNLGKGRAIQTALEHATGDVSIIHDADLEYNPRDILKMIPLFIEEQADAVFGSRFLSGNYRRILMFHHELGNKLLTFLCNLATNLNLTDMETCYKAIRTQLFKSIPIESNDFRFEPEITIKLSRRGARIFEVPISYSGRDYQEGKKINWRDGIKALTAMIKYWASDKIYKETEYGSRILGELSDAYRYNKWVTDLIRPYIGDNVLEIGSGVGNISKHLFPRKRYFVTDINSSYLDYLKNMKFHRPYLKVLYFDVTDSASVPELEENEIIDTVICMNVIEHLDDDRQALLNIKSLFKNDGKAIILVPNLPYLFNSLDEVLGHRRRYTINSLEALLKELDFEIVKILGVNRLGSLAWWINGNLLKRRHFSKLQVFILNLVTPFLKTLDKILPLPYLSIIAIGKVKTSNECPGRENKI